jgi:hypothetical protein
VKPDPSTTPVTTPADLLLTARVTPDGVFIGDTKLPGLIASDGVSAHAEWGGVNRLTVGFLVGRVEFDGEDAYPAPVAATPGGGSKSL